MLTVAYLANQFPSAVEPYVIDEIEELRSRGVRVIAGSVRSGRRDLIRRLRCTVQQRSYCKHSQESFCCVPFGFVRGNGDGFRR